MRQNLTPEEIEKIIRMRFEKGKDYLTISSEFNIDPGTVLYHCEKYKKFGGIMKYGELKEISIIQTIANNPEPKRRTPTEMKFYKLYGIYPTPTGLKQFKKNFVNPKKLFMSPKSIVKKY